jgi:RNA polymerase sigma-70 factor, ECF subfamily
VADTTVGFQFEYSQTAGATAATAADHALIDGLRTADEGAYETLILRFEQPVFSIVSRLLDDPGDAADVVQEVFLKVFRNVAAFRGDSSLKTWIYRIAVNEARNQRRWFGRHRSKEIGLEPSPTDARGVSAWLADTGRTPYEVTLDHEMRELIEAALKGVNPNFRAAVVLREIEGLSYDEIADILEVSLGTVKSRILRGREALRSELTALLAPAGVEHWTLPIKAEQADAL